MKYSMQATLDYAQFINKTECLKILGVLILHDGYIEQDLGFAEDEVVLDMDCVEHRIASNLHYSQRYFCGLIDLHFLT